MPSLRFTKVNKTQNDKALLLNLNMLEEKRERAAIYEAKSKERMEKYYNAKDTIRVQTCELTREEFTHFISLYLVPSEYRVMLPKPNQTIFDAPDGLNPFGCAKHTTFIIMCKAYGCEPTVDIFQGFFNSFPGGKCLTFSKRLEKHIPNLLPKVICCGCRKGLLQEVLQLPRQYT
ncbi:hypothetical protein Tco_1055764 [Tanacetum coccineum]|uniref:Uncharacterized protein n=1 Tax=Tanacetum coccineum TaxID=301880 RepID=A0ABQ5H0K9_9ASTR